MNDRQRALLHGGPGDRKRCGQRNHHHCRDQQSWPLHQDATAPRQSRNQGEGETPSGCSEGRNRPPRGRPLPWPAASTGRPVDRDGCGEIEGHHEEIQRLFQRRDRPDEEAWQKQQDRRPAECGQPAKRRADQLEQDHGGGEVEKRVEDVHAIGREIDQRLEVRQHQQVAGSAGFVERIEVVSR